MSAVPEARMMILLAALTALGATQESEAQELARVENTRQPVRLWMSNDRRYREGDRVRIQVDADGDRVLLVLNYAPTGRLRVLFPLDPRDDTRIEPGPAMMSAVRRPTPLSAPAGTGPDSSTPRWPMSHGGSTTSYWRIAGT